ncbi:bifunctional aspartokinase/homoserine dehydrogenase 1 isoform X2 [Impatiens glandulifera]|uniref:bifunctional aspartokinase/homoserine dehydrogenase 1 isoform X2 n=1 Tax=Impatiens glandulifera TaxID=253017 RepID=UPI001FB103BD|nr:bifunctional aspartokinase/homoserine dehydrogenase 1 isoform X2 [Impatiens glandulifera]
MKKIPLILMGCGGVGRQLLQHIVAGRSLHSKQGVHLQVLGVCDSQSSVITSDVLTTELDDTFLAEVCRIKSEGSPLLALRDKGECKISSGAEAVRTIIDVAALLARSTGLAFVDCSASSETIGVLKQVVDLGGFIIMANKKPLTSSMEDYQQLFVHQRHVRFESTVGAGLPVIAALNRMISSGDTIYRIVGSLSGTLGFVMSEVEDGKPFSEVVKTAKSLGYTEPDPRDDLGGMDVARKALILARLLGRKINLDNIKVESLYPEKMGAATMNVEDFLKSGLPELDKDFQERVQLSASRGNVLRYVCVIDESRCEVGLQELPKASPLGRLRGSDNIMEIYSRCYKNQPLVIQGAGAGNDTTAAGVLADILDIQDLFAK